MGTHPAGHLVNRTGALLSMLVMALLAYWKHGRAKRTHTWARPWSRSRILLLPGAFVVFAMLCVSSSVAQTPSHAGTLYKDPSGAFTILVPANWQAQRQAGSPMVSFVNEKAQASVSMVVVTGNKTNTPTPDQELDMIQGQFPQNCPEAKIQKRGPTTLGGIRGAFLLVNCTNSSGGLEVMKFIVASQPGRLVIFNSASPNPNYATVLPFINSMEHSLKILASAGAAAQTASTAAPDGSVNSSASAQSGSAIYRDAQGRYSLSVPDGWSAEPQADSGSLQLSSGPSWAMVLAGGGSVPVDVNHQITQQIQSQFSAFQMLNEGDLQINGHPSHGTTATGVNPKGMRVSVLVLSISAGNGHFLTVVSSSPNNVAKSVNATVMQMAQSIRFAGE